MCVNGPVRCLDRVLIEFTSLKAELELLEDWEFEAVKVRNLSGLRVYEVCMRRVFDVFF